MLVIQFFQMLISSPEREYLINTKYLLCKNTLFTRKSIHYNHVLQIKIMFLVKFL